MSRPISESLSLLSETLGNCKTNLKEKSVENVDNIKISDVDEKIAEIQAGGGNAEFQFSIGNAETLCDFISKNFSTLENGICHITNNKEPGENQTSDLSLKKDNSLICWIEGNILYISSPNKNKILFDNYYGLFMRIEGAYGSDFTTAYGTSPFKEIYFDDAAFTINLKQYFTSIFLGCSKLETVDISSLFSFDLNDQLSLGNLFNNLSNLKTIYCQEISEYKYHQRYSNEDLPVITGNNMFKGCSNLPNFNSSYTDASMAKWKENGGYFTNPSERVK